MLLWLLKAFWVHQQLQVKWALKAGFTEAIQILKSVVLRHEATFSGK